MERIDYMLLGFIILIFIWLLYGDATQLKGKARLKALLIDVIFIAITVEIITPP